MNFELRGTFGALKCVDFISPYGSLGLARVTSLTHHVALRLELLLSLSSPPLTILLSADSTITTLTGSTCGTVYAALTPCQHNWKNRKPSIVLNWEHYSKTVTPTSNTRKPDTSKQCITSTFLSDWIHRIQFNFGVYLDVTASFAVIFLHLTFL